MKLKTESSKTIKQLKEKLNTSEKHLVKEKKYRTQYEQESKTCSVEIEKLQVEISETKYKLTIELKELVSKQLHNEACVELQQLKSVKSQLDTVSWLIGWLVVYI